VRFGLSQQDLAWFLQMDADDQAKVASRYSDPPTNADVVFVDVDRGPEEAPPLRRRRRRAE
jgi:hypothetical protein